MFLCIVRLQFLSKVFLSEHFQRVQYMYLGPSGLCNWVKDGPFSVECACSLDTCVGLHNRVPSWVRTQVKTHSEEFSGKIQWSKVLQRACFFFFFKQIKHYTWAILSNL